MIGRHHDDDCSSGAKCHYTVDEDATELELL